jgi:outer membrane protein TolC
MDTFCNRKCCFVVSILLLLPALSLLAQEKIYSLPNLVDAAKNYLPSLMQKRAMVNSAQAIVTDTKHSFLPQLKASEQLNIGSANSMAGSYLPLGYMPSTSAAVRDNNNNQAVTKTV